MKKLWPLSLFARLALIWPLTLFIGHAIQGVIYTIAFDKEQIARTDYYVAKDLAILLPQLENAAPRQKQRWINQMARDTYHFELASAESAPLLNPTSGNSKTLTYISQQLGGAYLLSISAAEQPTEAYRVRLKLHDGADITAIIHKPVSGFKWINGLIFFLQMAALILFTWIAVKQATWPLLRLANAAESLGTSLNCQPISESGPSEVARAAAAFNIMQAQIKNHLSERVQILASISHDLQTPITRMRLRAELMDNLEQQQKWLADLNAMQLLVEEGITYARSAQRTTEIICRVDVDALLDSLVCDYVDAGQKVRISGEIGEILLTRPNALKRIMTNLIDNALKFAGEAEIKITHSDPTMLTIAVQDRGPGISKTELEAVLQPFYRVENSRNRHTGGTGLGLAIAHQLAQALLGTLSLKNRTGGGLAAILVFPKNLTQLNTD